MLHHYYLRLFTIGLLALQTSVAFAEHPVDVEQLTAKGEYLKALIAYEHIPRRIMTPGAMMAAGRSAWALSLPQRAQKEFDNALRTEKLGRIQAARAWFSKGAISFQEGESSLALLFATRASTLLSEPSSLRGNVYLLWGQILSDQRSFAPAEEKLTLALNEVSPSDRGEVFYQLGECHRALGKLDQAQADFQRVPLQHDRTPEAMRALAELALERSDYRHASFWLDRGRADFPDRFIDSWVDYALLQAAEHEGNFTKAREIVEAAAKKYPPADGWITLLNAEVEAFAWNKRMIDTADAPRAQRKPGATPP